MCPRSLVAPRREQDGSQPPTFRRMATGAHTFLFADIAGFTALTEAHGDEQAAGLAREFCRAVEELIPAGEGELVKSIGDAVMVRMNEPAAAVELGIRICDQVLAQHGAPTVRVGMHRGPAVQRDGDWFGSSVNVAARVAGLASGGEILITASVRNAVDEPTAIAFEDRGRHELRNVAEPVGLFAVRRDSRSAAERHLDPVCRMAVEEGRAAGMLRHDGVTYRFCSLECAAKFAAAPGRYAGR